MKKKLPLGISDFKELIEGDYTYIDKTLLIEELLESGTKVALIPRMRRFGKTLNLSMLRYFFEKTEKDTSYLFKNLAIWKSEKHRHLQGQFPVIFISFKDVKCATWEETFETLQILIGAEFKRHRYLLDGKVLFPEEKKEYKLITTKKASLATLTTSLLQLTEWLHRYHKKSVIVLIDEYDTPAHSAYLGNYYDTMISFLRSWLSGGLKDNNYLERGILTGILRIAKESIFSGLNNISTFTLLNEEFQDKFGLVETEVKDLLKTHELESKFPEITHWYDGYQIGSLGKIYNPWSVLNCMAKKGILSPYWINTSDNALVKQLITQGDAELKADIEELLKGGVIKKMIEEGIVFTDLEKNSDAIWSLFLFSGYLTLDSIPSYGIPCSLRIPNNEVMELYKSMILGWFKTSIQEPKYRMLLSSLVEGNIDTFSQIFKEFFLSTFSIFDLAEDASEKIYHTFVLGMLIGLMDKYEIKSNRESGLGRYDVMLIPKNSKDLGVIIEFKKVGRFEKTTLEAAVESALKQIENRHYAQELQDRGIVNILYLGLAFEGKEVLIRHKFN